MTHDIEDFNVSEKKDTENAEAKIRAPLLHQLRIGKIKKHRSKRIKREVPALNWKIIYNKGYKGGYILRYAEAS